MKLAKTDLHNILEGCKRGDSDCQKLLFDKFFGKILSICRRYLTDDEEAKDVTQESFILMFNKLEAYKGEGSFEGWLRRIVVNKAIDTFRKKKVKTYSIDEHDWSDVKDTTDSEDESIYNVIKPDVVIEHIQNLSPQYKTIFNLHVVEGYTHQQISDELKISVGTSKSNLSKARARLKMSLTKYLKKVNV